MGIETIIIASVVAVSIAASAVAMVMSMSQSKKTNNSLTQFNVTQCSEGLTIPRVYGTCVVSGNIDYYTFYYDKAKYNHNHVRVPVVSCRQIVASNPVVFVDILENNKPVGFPKLNNKYRYGTIWGYSGRSIPAVFRTCGSRWGRTGNNEWPHTDFKFKSISWLYFAYFIMDPGSGTFPNYQIKCRGNFSGILPTFGYDYSAGIGENPLLIVYDILHSCGENVDTRNFEDVTALCSQHQIGLNIAIVEQQDSVEVIKKIQEKTQIYFVKMGEGWRAIPFFQIQNIAFFLDYRYLSNFNFLKNDSSIYNFVVSYGRHGESTKTKQFNYSNVNENVFNIDFLGYSEVPQIVLNYILTNKMYVQSQIKFDIAFDFFKSITIGDVIEFEYTKLGIERDQYRIVEKNVDFENLIYNVTCVSINKTNQIYNGENGGEYHNTESIQKTPQNVTAFMYYELKNYFYILPILTDLETQNFLSYYLILNDQRYDELNEYGMNGYLTQNVDFLNHFDDSHSIYAYFDKKTIQQFSFESSINYYDLFNFQQYIKIGNEVIKFGYVSVDENTVIFSNLFREDPEYHSINDDITVFVISDANLIEKSNFLYSNKLKFLQYNENEIFDENQATQFMFFLDKIYLIDKIFFYFKKNSNIVYFTFFIYDWQSGAGVNEIEKQLSNFSPIFLGGDSFISMNGTKYTNNEINYTISTTTVNITYYKDSQNFISKNFNFSTMSEGFYDFA